MLAHVDNNFNPRSLAGATAIYGKRGAEFIISIHAPSRERQQYRTIKADHDNFNPRSLAGATWRFKRGYSGLTYFNPRSLAGATFKSKAEFLAFANFNPRSLAGATLLQE